MKPVQLAFAILAIGLAPISARAAGAGVPLDHVVIDHADKPSLQRGAQTFVNYCMGCHSASYHRYSRMAADLGLPEKLVEKNLIFTTDKKGARNLIGSPMESAMRDDYAKEAFGTVPPNLALVSRSRGADWLYTYMRTFYRQPDGGVNNLVFPDVAMPHVLWELQGWQEAEFETKTAADGKEKRHFVQFRPGTSGKLLPSEYDSLVRDLVNFLDYLGDPIRSQRHAIGFWVLLFLGVFWVIAIFLKREYWRDVH